MILLQNISLCETSNYE